MFSNEQWLANSGADFYNGVATQSLRWDFTNTSYLNKTFGSAGSRQKFTYSCWVKIAKIDTSDGYALLSVHNGTNNDTGYFHVHITNGNLNIGGYNTNWRTGGLEFRDPSAWYNFVIAVDTTQGTANNRVRVYVNNQEITTLYSGIGNMSQNANTPVGDACSHFIGRQQGVAGSQRSDGYMAECNMINNQQLTPSSFGETKNGSWIPIDTSSLTFGTNGFRLQFDQVGVGTASASTIGADTSGNNNHFTSNNIVASDCAMPDSPENNFATINSVMRANITLSEGNLKMVGVAQNTDNQIGTIAFDTNDSEGWYWEYRSIGNDAGTMIGICDTNNAKLNNHDPGPPAANVADGFGYRGDGVKENNNSQVSYGNSWAAGDIISVAIKSGSLFFYKNGTIQNSGTAAYTSISGEKVPFFAINGTQSGTVNFGQDSSFAGTETAQGNTDGNGIGDFYYAPPSGYLALCTANLPEPTIGANSLTQADDHFNTVLWTGDNNARSIDDVGFQPDWLWTKSRSNAESHRLHDSSRGDNGTVMYELNSDATEVEGTDTLVTGFDAEGFNIAAGGNTPNVSGRTYVAWNWKANGGTTSSNTDGSITSTVSANTDAGFSIVTYTGTGSNATVGHGLSSVPQMYIVKRRSNTGNWYTYHESIGNTKRLRLDETSSATTESTAWNNTSPTSSVFSIGTSVDVNAGSNTYVAYCFADVEGYSKFGSYTGNGSTDGTFVYTGFRPAFIIVKQATGVANWEMFDTTRSPSNVIGIRLFPSTTNAENAGEANCYDILSNGFKSRGAYGGNNISGEVHIYMAFAEAPFKYANAR